MTGRNAEEEKKQKQGQIIIIITKTTHLSNGNISERWHWVLITKIKRSFGSIETEKLNSILFNAGERISYFVRYNFSTIQYYWTFDFHPFSWWKHYYLLFHLGIRPTIFSLIIGKFMLQLLFTQSLFISQFRVPNDNILFSISLEKKSLSFSYSYFSTF